MINDIKEKVKMYLILFNCFKIIVNCPVNSEHGKMQRRHDSYTRTLIIGKEIYTIPVQRYWCKECNKPHSILPDFVVKHVITYVGDIVEMVRLKEQGVTFLSLAKDYIVTLTTIKRYIKKWVGKNYTIGTFDIKNST